MQFHFEIAGWEEPTDDDIEEWPKTRRVYIVSKSHRYESPVNLQELAITGIQFGRSIDGDMLREIQKRAGKITTHQPAVA